MNCITSTIFVEPLAYPSASALFLQGLREDSNLELDWLWLAAQLSNEGERRVCFLRALAINPHSQLAQHGLAQLAAASRSAPTSQLATD